MAKDTDRPIPPLGVSTDYCDIFALGTHGPIDTQIALALLRTETEHRHERGSSALAQSWRFVQEQEKRGPFLRAYCAFRELTQVYPITKHNWHSGERIPLIHAWETASESVVLAFRAHYKSAYQRLREVLELVVLQQFFYTSRDKSIVATWGRGETRTPSFKTMLKRCGENRLYAEASDDLGITEKITQAYDDLGAYIHTRGVPATGMGLSASNTLAFSPAALGRFCGFFFGVARLSVLMLASFFPPAVVAVPAFQKLGHRDPAWLPRRDHVDCICSILAEDECSFLRKLAEKNAWFQRVVAKLDQLPDLTPEERDRTYDELQGAAKKGPHKVQELLKATNALVE